jgi:hypothetical protein
MDAVTAANDVDLSGYSVTVTRGMLGWLWRATDPNGDLVPHFPNFYATRSGAERAALQVIEQHAEPQAPISGKELRRRVHESVSAETLRVVDESLADATVYAVGYVDYDIRVELPQRLFATLESAKAHAGADVVWDKSDSSDDAWYGTGPGPTEWAIRAYVVET